MNTQEEQKMLAKITEALRTQETVTSVHEHYCKHCPTRYGPGDDPESIATSNLPDGERQKFLIW